MTGMPTTPEPPTPSLRSATAPQVILNLVRGALIGAAELVPGISGGTVALITGVYERLIASVSHLMSAMTRLVRGPDRAAGVRAELRRTDWWLVGPVLVGMAAMVLTLAGVVEGLVSANPVASRGLFFGLVAASLIVPLRMAWASAPDSADPRDRGPVRLTDVVLFVLSAVGAFLLIGLAEGETLAEPPMWLVFAAAAIAVCALVIPGVSGSFFLLAIGLYSTTLQALSSRDLGYIAVFAAGALVGLVTIVRGMSWLLRRHRRATLVAMTGLLVGSLRALWPWQTSPSGDADGVGVLLPPGGDMLTPVLLALAGAAIVGAMILVEDRLSRRSGIPAGVEQDAARPAV